MLLPAIGRLEGGMGGTAGEGGSSISGEAGEAAEGETALRSASGERDGEEDEEEEDESEKGGKGKKSKVGIQTGRKSTAVIFLSAIHRFENVRSIKNVKKGLHKDPPFFPFSFPASGVRAGGGGGGAGDTLLAGETDPYSGSGLKSFSNMPLMSLTRPPPPPSCCFLLLLLSSSSSPLPTPAEEGESVVGEGREAASGVEWPGEII